MTESCQWQLAVVGYLEQSKIGTFSVPKGLGRLGVGRIRLASVIRPEGARKLSPGKPWAKFSWRLRAATDWERPNSFRLSSAKHIRRCAG
jgi:hypothetical protein